MSLLRHETVTINRYTTSFLKGRPQTLLDITFTTEANIQPLKGDELLRLPIGNRNKETYWMYTDDEILIKDEVVRDGKKFEASPSEDWSRAGRLQHYKVMIVAKDNQ